MDHHTRQRFCANLKHACSTRGSISQFCREIGLNRQQFNRYINGQAKPSDHNLLRIASAFGLEPEDFTVTKEEFRLRLASGPAPADPRHPLLDAFPGDLPALRRYLGFYQSYYLSLSWPGHVVCSCAHLREEEGHVVVTTLERIEDADSGIKQRSRYVGLAAFRRNRIFLTERTRGDAPTFGQTVLMPFEVHQRLFLRGVTMGVSWRKDNQPYASRMIWRHHGTQTDRRALIARCGVYSVSSGELPSPVAAYLSASDPLTVTPK